MYLVSNGSWYCLLVPLQLIARRIVGSLEPEAPFFPPPQNSAFRRAQMQDEEDEM